MMHAAQAASEGTATAIAACSIVVYIGLAVFKAQSAARLVCKGKGDTSFWQTCYNQSKHEIWTFLIFVWCIVWVSVRRELDANGQVLWRYLRVAWELSGLV